MGYIGTLVGIPVLWHLYENHRLDLCDLFSTGKSLLQKNFEVFQFKQKRSKKVLNQVSLPFKSRL